MKRQQINRQRQRRGFRVRNKVRRHATRPRLSVFRSHKHIYAQVIDDRAEAGIGRTVAAASTQEKDIRQQVGYGGNCKAATVVGRLIAERALAAGVKQVAFDRREYRYHGRVAALADAARDAGLDLGAKKPLPEPKQAPPGKKKGEKAEKGGKGEKAGKGAKGEKPDKGAKGEKGEKSDKGEKGKQEPKPPKKPKADAPPPAADAPPAESEPKPAESDG